MIDFAVYYDAYSCDYNGYYRVSLQMDDGFMDERNALDDLDSLEVMEEVSGRQDLDFTAAVFAHVSTSHKTTPN